MAEAVLSRLSPGEREVVGIYSVLVFRKRGNHSLYPAPPRTVRDYDPDDIITLSF